jgi:hypothetical protein
MTEKLPKITIMEGGLVQIAAFDCALGRVAKQTIDVTTRAGETVRIWLDENKKYSTDPHRDHYWQMAELAVPERQFSETESVDADGKPTIVREPIPIDLANVEILAWELPA